LSYSQDLSKVDADLAIVLGGDGSILRAARQMGDRQVPILGVNLGRLGFLADVQPDELISVFPSVCAGDCRVVEHLMLKCSILRDGRELGERLGLNEVAILSGPPYSILNIDLYVDANLATTYSCDGLIISTPVGSTAHSLSAGGPILRKNLQAFVILPISPHTLTVRPVVDAADRIYEVVVQEPNETTSIVVDGEVFGCLTSEDRIRVQRAEPRFKLVEIRGRNYYRTLREKLGWRGDLGQN
jgi:NAD+ kinase